MDDFQGFLRLAGFHRYARHMLKLILRLLLVVLFASVAGCSLWKKDKTPKSSARVYDGDAPSIRYSDEPEAAGGPLTPY